MPSQMLTCLSPGSHSTPSANFGGSTDWALIKSGLLARDSLLCSPTLIANLFIQGAANYTSILRILDAVGTSRYQGRIMREDEEDTFGHLVQLVTEGNSGRAEEVAESALNDKLFQRPFVPWYEWDYVKGDEG